MSQTGSYSVNLLGSIASNLAGLQGYDVMALELIQNADDARASSIEFDITDDALVVTNDGVFSSCRNLSESHCPFLQGPDRTACDFHRLTELASGGKARDSKNIGRFGIGFVSTYQICDHPEVRSSGTSLVLFPEEAKTDISDIDDEGGTTFVLPWANDPSSVVREGIKASHIEKSDLSQIERDIAGILDRALLFLQHLTRAELRRNGRLVRSCNLRRDDDDILIIEFGPKKCEEMWLICEADAGESVAELIDDFAQLGLDDRRTQVTLAYRLDSEPVNDGLFYAFLPTEQRSGLPVHVNADFYPEADRKSIIFSGAKHQQRWNELLIKTAALELAENLVSLKDKLGPDLIWETIQQAWKLDDDATTSWESYFWSQLTERISEDSVLAWSSNGRWTQLRATILPTTGLSDGEIDIVEHLGLHVAHDCITKRAQTVLQIFGTTYLSAKRLATVLEDNSWFDDQISATQVTEAQKKSIFQPLWRLVDRLSASLKEGQSGRTYFGHIQFLLTGDLRPVAPDDARTVYEAIHTALSDLVPELNLLDRSIYQHSAAAALVPPLTVTHISHCLDQFIDSAEDAQMRFGERGEKVHRFYRAVADLSEDTVEQDTALQLRSLPIFFSGNGYRTADAVSLPGNFKDPIGFATILERSVLDDVVEAFFIERLDIDRLDLHSYVSEVLPRFFESDGDVDKVNRLLAEFARHRETLDDIELANQVRQLPLVPAQNGTWCPANQVYYRTEQLVDVVGDNSAYWIDEAKLDPAPSIRAYVDKLGVRRKPSGAHLAARVLGLAEGTPTKLAKQQCELTFYAVCDFVASGEKADLVEVDTFVSNVVDHNCLPALEDDENWWRPAELYAPYNAEAFSSQASILPFRNTKKIPELVRRLGIKDSPETTLVVEHLKHCVESKEAPSKAVYEVLNGRCDKDSDAIRSLRELACIYDENRQRFLRPNQLFWDAPHLGNRALKVPSSFRTYQRLFETLGVKTSPSADDYFDLIEDVINEYGDTGHTVPEQDLQIYRKCLEIISEAITDGDEQIEERCRTLREEACLLNFDGKLCFPDEIAIRDSEWHETHFEEELRGMLTDYQAELQPFYRAVRVKRVSEVIKPEITQRSGDEELSPASQLLQDRADCVIRILHDRPRQLLADLFLRLTSIQVICCEELEITFVCSLTEPAVRSPEHPTIAHYEKDTNVLYVARRDVENFSVPALNSVLHILATSASGASIPNLVLNCDRMLTSSSLEAAEEILTYAGFPSSVDLEESDIEDEELGDVGSQSDAVGDDLPTVSPGSNDEEQSGAETDPSRTQSESGQEGAKKKSESEPTGEGGSGKRSKSSKKKRGQRRKDRLLSYVNHGKDGDSEKTTDPSIRAHNLTVEDKGRAAVVLFEKERGREGIPQAQENPGWDIVSTDIETEDVRYIEVKAIDGEWSNVGVGLSRLQFSEAWERHDNYWLYVVEFAGHPDKELVYPIQSPASKVTSFMFDRNWRDIADIEIENPHAAFQVDAMIDCGLLGIGRITEIQERGRTKLLIIDFGRGNIKAINLNIATMKVIEETEA